MQFGDMLHRTDLKMYLEQFHRFIENWDWIWLAVWNAYIVG